jgi:hypothetical protein
MIRQDINTSLVGQNILVIYQVYDRYMNQCVICQVYTQSCKLSGVSSLRWASSTELAGPGGELGAADAEVGQRARARARQGFRLS